VSVTGRRRLRSSDIDTCLAQRTNTRLGDRSFAAAGPRVWNSLPTQLRESDITLGQFRRALKTHLYGYWQLQRRVTVFFRSLCMLPYLSVYCVPVASAVTRRHLRSANSQLLAVPRYRLNTYGRRAFSVAGPTVWNSLPDFIRDPTISAECFRRLLKTYLFARY